MEFFIKNTRRTFTLLLIGSLGLMSVALFLEHFLKLEPCILCYMQRGAVILIGTIAALGLILNSTKISQFKGLISAVFLVVITGADLSIILLLSLQLNLR